MLMEKPASKKQKVTTFKLTDELTHALDLIAARDGCTKDAAIRRMIALGLETDTDTEIQALRQQAKQHTAEKTMAPVVRRPHRA